MVFNIYVCVLTFIIVMGAIISSIHNYVIEIKEAKQEQAERARRIAAEEQRYIKLKNFRLVAFKTDPLIDENYMPWFVQEKLEDLFYKWIAFSSEILQPNEIEKVDRIINFGWDGDDDNLDTTKKIMNKFKERVSILKE